MTENTTGQRLTLHEYLRTTRKLFVSPRDTLGSRSWPRAVYNIGCRIENQVLLAHGLHRGVFPPEQTKRLIHRGDEIIRELRQPEVIEEAGERLPAYLSVDELLEPGAASDASPNAFRSLLWFRRYEATLGLDAFHANLLFASNDQWSRDTEVASSVDLPTAARERSLKAITGIYDAVRHCCNLVAWLTGRPLGEVDPWGVSEDPKARLPIRRAYLTHLDKADHHTAAVVTAALHAATYDGRAASAVMHLIRDALLLNLIEFSRLPAFRRSTGRDEIVSAIRAPDTMQLAFRLDPQLAWATALWRLAPTDDRSRSRARQATGIMVRWLEESGLRTPMPQSR